MISNFNLRWNKNSDNCETTEYRIFNKIFMIFPQLKKIVMGEGSAWLAQSEEHSTLDLGIMSLSPTVGTEIIKNKL